MNTLPSGYTPRPDLLKDKIIVVTGAGAGIGRSAALSFAAHGATVVLLGRTIQKLETVYDEIEAAGGPQPAIYPINFEGACAKDFDDLAQAMFDEFGKVDGLLHNAADLGERTPLNNYAPDTWIRVMQVNVNAPFMLTRALLPVMNHAPAGSIVFTGSSVGYEGRAFWGAYAASKAANENMMQTLAQELEGTTKIRANSINPGATRTQMRAAAYPAEDPSGVKPAEDLMPLYLYLMGDDSVAVSGQQFEYSTV
ncbi:YciK family oxidoreductase [Pseudomaricurvus hydrocarbonicus]|nr:YciK family oxidoreductase [Aestuariicella hydrocarbonica]